MQELDATIEAAVVPTAKTGGMGEDVVALHSQTASDGVESSIKDASSLGTNVPAHPGAASPKDEAPIVGTKDAITETL